MLPPGLSKSLVTDEFNQMCVEMKVEARVQITPNPGNPFKGMRLITFKNFSNEHVTVIEQNKRKRKHILQPKAELQIAIGPDDSYPEVKKGILNG